MRQPDAHDAPRPSHAPPPPPRDRRGRFSGLRRILLAERWQRYRRTGDVKAREDLVLAYAPIVKVVVTRLAARMPSHVTAADLMSDGFKGLIEAVERFDPAQGTDFERYAGRRIHGAVLDGLRSLDWVPREVRTQAREIEHATAALAMRLRRMPTDAELAAELSLSPAQLHAALQAIADARVVALDEPLAATDGVGGTRLEGLPDPSTPDPAARLDADDHHERIGTAVRKLPERDQVILGLHYHQDLSFSQIADILGVSASRVSRLHTKAALQLRTLIELDR